MTITYSRHHLPGLAPFFIATDQDAADEYTLYVRGHLALQPPMRFVAAIMRQMDRFIDLGANLGHFTLALAPLCRRVLAVEGLPLNYSLLAASVRKNGLRNVTPVHAAVHDHTGTLYMAGGSAWGQVHTEATDKQVPCLTLDDLCATYDFERPDIVKIDIEGSELAALRGGPHTLGRDADLVVVFEANAYCAMTFGYPVARLLTAFEELGFHLYLFAGDRLVPRRSTDFQESVLADYVAIRNPRRIPSSFTDLRPLTTEEGTAMLVHGIRHGSVPHSAYLHAMQNRLPASLRNQPEVQQLLEKLRADENPELLAISKSFASVPDA